jgi:hypothetical protein
MAGAVRSVLLRVDFEPLPGTMFSASVKPIFPNFTPSERH